MEEEIEKQAKIFKSEGIDYNGDNLRAPEILFNSHFLSSLSPPIPIPEGAVETTSCVDAVYLFSFFFFCFIFYFM